LADVYDALTTERVYKPRFSHETSREMIREGRGTQFDPDVVDAFLRREEDFVAVARRFDQAEGAEGEAALLTPAQPLGELVS
jgi:putative two-component system response regulator